MKYFKVAVLHLALYLGCCWCDPNLIVETPLGVVEGHYLKSYKGRTFAAFEGIPYAKPPVGDLRFKEPQLPDKWDGTLVANASYYCAQYLPFKMMEGVKGTEDCLYVYVYVPREKIDANENLDVVIHIHGGIFMIGAPKMMADPIYMMDQDVVFVSMNYRLGILGFLSTEDDVVPGNNGLKDQSMALGWIKDNIKHFGGNPDSITLTGLSAGGASVHFHYFSPLSKGLFHKGFSQSGTAFQHWALTEEPLEKAKFVAAKLDCDTSSTDKMIECLRKLPAEKLILGIKHIFVLMDSIPFAPFAPTIEKPGTKNGFMTEHPYKMLLDKNFANDVPWIASNTKDEGIIPAGFMVMLKVLHEMDEKWNELMPYALDINNTVDDALKVEVVQKIKKFYFGSERLTKQTSDQLTKMYTHRTYVIDSEKAVRLHTKMATSPVYFYLFEYLLQQPFPFSLKKGAGHSDDGKLLYHFFYINKNLKPIDEKMMEIFTSFLATYAKTGIPKLGGNDWTPVKPDEKELDYLHILSPEDISMKSINELGPTEFWNSLPIKENDKLFS